MRSHPRIETALQTVREREPFPGYLDHTKAHIRFVAAQLMRFRPPPARLLDVGCGPLDKTAVFSALGYDCYACDDFRDPWHRRDGNLDKIIAFAAASGVRLHIQERGFDLPWPAAFFEVVTVLDVVEHLHASPRDLFNLVGSHLAPGGLVVVTTPNAVNARKRLDVLMGRSNYPPLEEFLECVGPWRGHVREFTSAEVMRMLTWAGFDVIGQALFTAASGRGRAAPAWWAYRILAPLVPSLRDQIVAIGRKPAAWLPRPADESAARARAAHSVPVPVA